MVVNTFSHTCVNWNSNRRPSLKPTMQQKQWTIILFCFCSGCIMTNEMINESSSHYRVRQSWGVFFLSVSSSVIASSDEINHVLCNSPWSYSYSISSCEDLTHRRQRLGCEIRTFFSFSSTSLTPFKMFIYFVVNVIFCALYMPRSHMVPALYYVATTGLTAVKRYGHNFLYSKIFWIYEGVGNAVKVSCKIGVFITLCIKLLQMSASSWVCRGGRQSLTVLLVQISQPPVQIPSNLTAEHTLWEAR